MSVVTTLWKWVCMASALARPTTAERSYNVVNKEKNHHFPKRPDVCRCTSTDASDIFLKPTPLKASLQQAHINLLSITLTFKLAEQQFGLFAASLWQSLHSQQECIVHRGRLGSRKCPSIWSTLLPHLGRKYIILIIGPCSAVVDIKG